MVHLPRTPDHRANDTADAGADDDDDDDRGRPSKTRRKQDAHDLQSLGVALLELSDARLADIGLPEPLQDALRETRRITGHEARRRHLQRIGKLMRGLDEAPLAAARRAIDELRLGRAGDALALHRAEQWRAELIADDGAAGRFLAAHAGADAQQLRALVRQARKDAAASPQARSGRAFRELFRYVREHASRDVDAGADPGAAGGASA